MYSYVLRDFYGTPSPSVDQHRVFPVWPMPSIWHIPLSNPSRPPPTPPGEAYPAVPGAIQASPAHVALFAPGANANPLKLAYYNNNLLSSLVEAAMIGSGDNRKR
eukprot:8454022-Pyramimonas_sp.AAC.1